MRGSHQLLDRLGPEDAVDVTGEPSFAPDREICGEPPPALEQVDDSRAARRVCVAGHRQQFDDSRRLADDPADGGLVPGDGPYPDDTPFGIDEIDREKLARDLVGRGCRDVEMVRIVELAGACQRLDVRKSAKADRNSPLDRIRDGIRKVDEFLLLHRRARTQDDQRDVRPQAPESKKYKRGQHQIAKRRRAPGCLRLSLPFHDDLGWKADVGMAHRRSHNNKLTHPGDKK